jgi:hypothetical protein
VHVSRPSDTEATVIDLESYSGRRIEVEIDGRRVRGQVTRGPGRTAVLLEERGQVGEHRSDTHRELSMLKTWTARQLAGATLVEVLSSELAAKPKTKQTKPKRKPWNETVALAEADPSVPSPDWDGGLLAWAEAVHTARRRVDRGRKAMMEALREAAG